MTYQEFIASKIPRAESSGFEPMSEPHVSLFGHQRDIAHWAARGGRRAVFAAFGLGKTRIHLQLAKWICEREPSKKYLIVAPLGVRQEFTKVEGPALGLDVTYCRTDAEVAAVPSQIIITNYERIRDDNITVSGDMFAGAGLDESSVLRSYGSKTYQTFLPKFKTVPFRYVFTATPSPNRYKELIHYGGFLGILDTGEALTRFFQRDSTQANNLTLMPAQEDLFWEWLSSWAVFLQRPSDLGYSDEGYDLPPMKVHWHVVPVDHRKAWKQHDSWGQAQMFQDAVMRLKDVAGAKRETIVTRLGRASEIMEASDPGTHWMIWHDLEAERYAIERGMPDVVTVFGNQDLEIREENVLKFGRGEIAKLASKPILTGSGTNLQRHCWNQIFLGASYKFNDFIQAIHRFHRFQQKHEVNVHIIVAESETHVVETLKTKWRAHDALVARMTELIRKHGLAVQAMHLQKSTTSNRREVSGELFRVINNDTVQEVECWPDNCVDCICSSVPFGVQYEYTPDVRDFGHNANNEAFFKQMEFLIPNLLRVLRPGRVAAIHVKDRIRFGNVTGLGFPTVDAFSDETRAAMIRGGFHFVGRITIDTDVVRENNQTYRLGWTECTKDGTKMGVGMPEYVLLFRKAPSDTSDGYADLPVTKDKENYTRAQWQVDASALWKSDGNRMPNASELVHVATDQIGRIWKEHCLTERYSYREHVEIGVELEKCGKLPACFMLFPPVSKNPEIWTDIVRMRVLDPSLSEDEGKKHICPLQLDVVERLINRFTNPGEIVFDPFMGIGTVPSIAVRMGRKGWGIELAKDYWSSAVGYCETAENEVKVPTLFDLDAMVQRKESTK